MEIGAVYLISYEDDKARPHTKLLILKEIDDVHYHFFNPKTKLPEGIRRKQIIRYEQRTTDQPLIKQHNGSMDTGGIYNGRSSKS